MKKVVMVLHDKKSRAFGNPMVYDTVDVAIRDIHRAITLGRDMKDGQRPLIAMYPEDFELCHVADFDVETGVITPREGFVFYAVDEIVSFKEN